MPQNDAGGLVSDAAQAAGRCPRSLSWLRVRVRALTGKSGPGDPLASVPPSLRWMGNVLQQAAGVAEAMGFPVYLVGGIIRDWLLDITPSRDVDLVLEGTREETKQYVDRLGRALEARVAWHESFGTATLDLHGGERVDVAMARREVYSEPAALPRVAPAPLSSDLERRDFTINAMAVRLDGPDGGTLIDPVGGRQDLARGLLVVLHPDAFADDPTRLFRALQYEARTGLRMSPWTEALARQAIQAALPDRLSRFRLQQAVRLAFSETDPAWVATRLAALGFLDRLAGAPEWLEAGSLEPVRLGGMADEPVPCLDRMRAYLARVDGAWDRCRAAHTEAAFPDPFPERWQARVLMCLSLLPSDVRDAMTTRAIQSRVIRERMGRWWASRATILSRLDSPDPPAPSQVVAMLTPLGAEGWIGAWTAVSTPRAEQRLDAYLRRHRLVGAPLTGGELVAAGMPPGPEVAGTLSLLRRKALDEGIGRGEAMALVREILDRSREGASDG